MSKNKNILWALSLTLTILSLLATTATVVGFIYLTIAYGQLDDQSLLQNLAGKLDLGSETSLQNGSLNIGGLTAPLKDLLHTGLTYFLILLIFTLAGNIVSLIAGIFGLSNYKNKNKQKFCFGWGIAGTIASLVNIRLVSTIIFIIYSVKVHNFRFEDENDDVDDVIGKHIKK